MVQQKMIDHRYEAYCSKLLQINHIVCLFYEVIIQWLLPKPTACVCDMSMIGPIE